MDFSTETRVLMRIYLEIIKFDLHWVFFLGGIQGSNLARALLFPELDIMKVMYWGFFYLRSTKVVKFNLKKKTIEPCQYKKHKLALVLRYALIFLIHGLAHRSL